MKISRQATSLVKTEEEEDDDYYYSARHRPIAL